MGVRGTSTRSQWISKGAAIPQSLLHRSELEIQTHILITTLLKESTNNCNSLFPFHAISLRAKLLLSHNWKTTGPEATQQFSSQINFQGHPRKVTNFLTSDLSEALFLFFTWWTNKQSLHKQRREKTYLVFLKKVRLMDTHVKTYTEGQRLYFSAVLKVRGKFWWLLHAQNWFIKDWQSSWLPDEKCVLLLSERMMKIYSVVRIWTICITFWKQNSETHFLKVLLVKCQ